MLSYRTNHVLPKSQPKFRPNWDARGTRRPYTKEESDLAVRLRLQGLTFEAIGVQIGRTGPSVQNHLEVWAKKQMK